MLSKKLEAALNAQIEMETKAVFTYLQFASWCNAHKLEGCAKFFYRQADEEFVHMKKFFTYINDIGGVAISPAVSKPGLKIKSIRHIIEAALANEIKVTKAIHELSELANKEKDYATYNFLQYFVDEQLEEEVQFQTILDKIELIGMEGMGLYYIDKEFKTLAVAAETAPPNQM
ncbi:MAG TPA: ferritin [Flavobacteriales bacterium]|nr:ferritin [Flavobacteriales bacterium]